MSFRETLFLNDEKLILESIALVSSKFSNEGGLGSPKEHCEIGQSYLYGISSIYRLTTNLLDGNLGCIFCHGLGFNDNYVDRCETHDTAPIIIYSKYNNLRNLGAARPRRLVNSPTPVALTDWYFHQHAPISLTSGKQYQKAYGDLSCLYFLNHSTTWINSFTDSDYVQKHVRRLRQEYKTVNLMIYFRDLPRLPGISFLFDNVFCCGHMLDPRFLARQYRLLKMHSAVSYNQWGSHAFWAASLGLKVIHGQDKIKLSLLECSDNPVTNRDLQLACCDEGERFGLALDAFEGLDISQLLRFFCIDNDCIESVISEIKDIKRKEKYFAFMRSIRSCAPRLGLAIGRRVFGRRI